MNDKNKLVALILSKKVWHGVLKIDVCTNTNTKSLYNGLREVVNSHSKKKTNEGEMGNPKRRKCTASNIEEWRNKHFKTSQKPAYNSLENVSSVVFSLWEYFGH